MLNACYPGVFDSGLGLSQSDILLIGGLVPFLSFPASPIIGKLDKGYQDTYCPIQGFEKPIKRKINVLDQSQILENKKIM